MAARESSATVPSQGQAVAAAPTHAFLLVVGPGHLGTHPLAADRDLTIGRDAACGISLAHHKVSRRHVTVKAAPSAEVRCAVVVEDLGSTNGIQVAGHRLDRGVSVVLVPGDSFQLGPFTVLVVAEERQGTSMEDLGPASLTVADPTPAGVSPMVARIAESLVNVLILGETGSGKEVLARTIHQLSGRRGPFVGINTAAISETLLESELFGYERGAFTGAVQAKRGLLETAPQGTVFLDEIGDLSAALQAKLLRAIETREVYRVGGVKPVALDVRILSATHRDLGAAVTTGGFRSDLYYRLNGVTLELLPLRERRGSIAGLARTFLSAAAAAAGRPPPRMGLEVITKLTRYDWPGNVRELRAVVERALLLTSGDELQPRAILINPTGATRVERESFLELARRHRGNVSVIAGELATSRSQVHRLAQRFGIDLERLRADQRSS